jgi:hypothetical protein
LAAVNVPARADTMHRCAIPAQAAVRLPSRTGSLERRTYVSQAWPEASIATLRSPQDGHGRSVGFFAEIPLVLRRWGSYICAHEVAKERAVTLNLFLWRVFIRRTHRCPTGDRASAGSCSRDMVKQERRLTHEERLVSRHSPAAVTPMRSPRSNPSATTRIASAAATHSAICSR